MAVRAESRAAASGWYMNMTQCESPARGAATLSTIRGSILMGGIIFTRLLRSRFTFSILSHLAGADRLSAHRIAFSQIESATLKGGIDGDNSAPDEEETPGSIHFNGRTFAQTNRDASPGSDESSFDMTTHDYTIMARIKTEADGAVFAKTVKDDLVAHGSQKTKIATVQILLDSPGASNSMVFSEEHKNTVEQTDIAFAVSESAGNVTWKNEDGNLRLVIPAGTEPVRFAIYHCLLSGNEDPGDVAAFLPAGAPAEDLSLYIHGGARTGLRS